MISEVHMLATASGTQQLLLLDLSEALSHTRLSLTIRLAETDRV